MCALKHCNIFKKPTFMLYSFAGNVTILIALNLTSGVHDYDEAFDFPAIIYLFFHVQVRCVWKN